MFDSLKKYFSQIKKLLKKLGKFFEANPKNNWATIVIIFVIINLFLLTGKVMEFYRISSDSALLSGNFRQSNVDTINRTSLNETIFRFETKNENYKDLKQNRPSFSDPSI